MPSPLHRTEWFLYDECVSRLGRLEYRNCVLTRHLTLACSSVDMLVSFHNEGQCRIGARLPLIVETAEGSLYGFDARLDLVLDLVIPPPALSKSQVVINAQC